jgi:putative ABC transport system permease protein
MLPVLRKAVADLRGARLQSILILTIVLAATATLYLAFTVQRSGNDPWERTFAEANGAHIAFGAAPGVDLTRIATIEGVTETSGPFPIVWERSIVRGTDRYDVALMGMPVEQPAVGRLLVTEGSWLSGTGREIVLNRTLAREEGIRTGDQVQVPAGGELVTLEVVGLAIDTNRGPYPNWDTTVAWVSPDTLRVFAPESAWETRFFVRLSDPEASFAVTNAANAMYPETGGFGTDDWHEVRDDVNEFNTIVVIMFSVFAVTALAAVAFIIANTIAGRVLAQYRDIGVLKAIGFTPGQVTLVFLVQHLLLSVVAGLIGVGVGVLLAPLFLDETADMLNTPAASSFNLAVAVVVVLGVLVIVGLFTLLPAWRGGRIAPVQAITTGFNPSQRRASVVARLASWAHLPLMVVTGVKDVFTRPGRALLTIVALLMTVMTFVFALGMNAMIDKLVDNPALSGDAFDATVVAGTIDQEVAERIFARHDEIVAFHGRASTRASLVQDGETLSFQVRGLGGQYDAFPYAIGEGRMIAAPGETVVGIGLINLLDLQIGDEMQVTVNNQPLALRIVGRVLDDEDQAELAFMTLETLQAVDPSLQPNVYALLLKEGTDTEALKTALTQESGYEFGVDIVEPGAGDVGAFRAILLGLSAVLLTIGLVNLLTTTLLNVRERARDFGIFKATGMTPRQVVQSVASGVSLLALIAVAIGIPLGLWIYESVFRAIAEGQGADPTLYTAPDWWALLLLVPGAVVLAALASALPARRAANVQVAEVLRYE